MDRDELLAGLYRSEFETLSNDELLEQHYRSTKRFSKDYNLIDAQLDELIHRGLIFFDDIIGK